VGQYSKAIAATIAALVIDLNLLLPITQGQTKIVVTGILSVLGIMAVFFAPKNTPTV
jgi:hypothetical protein